MMDDTYLRVFEKDGSVAEVKADLLPSIDAAVGEWIASGGTRDKLLHLEMTDGDEYTVRASRITAWLVSTADGRRRSVEYEAEKRAERLRFRHEAGIFDADEP